MMTIEACMKLQSTLKLKTKEVEEIQVLYEKIKRSDEDFISIGSAEDERLVKKMNEKGIDSSKNEVIKDESKEEAKEESKEEAKEESKDEESNRKRKLDFDDYVQSDDEKISFGKLTAAIGIDLFNKGLTVPLEVVFTGPVDEASCVIEDVFDMDESNVEGMHVHDKFAKFFEYRGSMEKVLSATKLPKGGNSHSTYSPYHLEDKAEKEKGYSSRQRKAVRDRLAMSSDNASFAVTYTSISSYSNGPSWGIPLMSVGKLPEMDPYKEPEHPEYHVPSDDDMQVEDQPYLDDASPTAESPGHIADSESMEEDSINYPDKPEDDDEDPKEDLEEDHTDYPADREDGDDEPSDDDDDDDEDEDPTEDEEDEEHLDSANFSTVPVVDLVPLARDIEAFETYESAPTPRSPQTRVPFS
ncbi:hypothetical protein Tco_0804204 [Tanacetum coccineum]|uniref:Uncharacterized protein n=1 Tax=Tanacetum coccineum TaxID=301880 RepID=A0ABQ5A6G8_9ASTR